MYEEIYIYNNNNKIGIAKVYMTMEELSDYRIYFEVNNLKIVKDWYYGY